MVVVTATGPKIALSKMVATFHFFIFRVLKAYQLTPTLQTWRRPLD